jgi:hypothetical protein
MELISLGMETAANPDPNRRTWIFSQEAADFLVFCTINDEDRDVRNHAARILIEKFPDKYLRKHAAALTSALHQDRTDWDIRLLAKTGSAEAATLLESDPRFRKSNNDLTDDALAKLGNTDLSIKAIAAFQAEKDPAAKGRLCDRLAFIGDAACVLALAKSIRDGREFDVGNIRTQVRVRVAQALGQIYPENEVFWTPSTGRAPQQNWYESIEAWLTKYLGVSWEQQRPPFFFDYDISHD